VAMGLSGIVTAMLIPFGFYLLSDVF